MEIKNSLDFEKAISEIDKQYQTIYDKLPNKWPWAERHEFQMQYERLKHAVTQMKNDLSREEVEARRTKNNALANEKLKAVNNQLLFIEQNLMFLSLGM